MSQDDITPDDAEVAVAIDEALDCSAAWNAYLVAPVDSVQEARAYDAWLACQSRN